MHTTSSKSAPETHGNLIRWGKHYDGVVRLMMLGQDKKLRQKTVDLAAIKAGDSVLDVGCGTGSLTLVAQVRAGSAGKVYGIDASPEMIDVARSKAAGSDVDFRVNVIEALPFTDNTFDVVLSSLMMHHLPDDLKLQGMKEIYRVLKPGGHVFIVDAKRPTTRVSRILLRLTAHHAINTGVQDLPVMLEAAGFADVETGNIGGFRPLGFARGSKR